FAMPPIPGKTDYNNYQIYPSEKYSRNNPAFRDELPQNILAIMVQFNDITFDLVPDYPDSLSHDKEYFERLFFHLTSFYTDASHGNYTLTEDNYTVWDDIITLSQSMGYYGENGENGDLIERKCEFVQEIVELIDDQLDFNDYDAIIIIHAGAGEEAAGQDENEDQLSSTFLSRRSLQAGLDPENDDFPGIETEDGIYLTEFVIIPETEWQPNGVPGEDTIYSIFGVLVHQFGHQLGLPTLFDNNRDNGISYGIGGFGVMGTGVWNANGFVPPLPCAWSRYYLGWEDDNIVEINSSFENLSLVFPMADDEINPKIYKLKITEDEYFLIENRQQNPDGSIFINVDGDTLATFTFETIAGQSVYPQGHAYAGQPKFSFMENTYAGSEWDFYLPGHGFGAELEMDGSGILIWHIDENIINENFTPDFEVHSVNGDASHKGVDLEEADGIQQLDNTLHGYSSFFGSVDDSYREGNNTYFGKNYYNDIFSTPTSESYYGGIPLEVMDISTSDSLMTFSVRYEWALNADYIGENNLPAMIIDFDDDGENEILQTIPNGEVYLWKDDQQYPGFPIDTNSSVEVPFPSSYDENANSVLMPAEISVTNSVSLFEINLSIQDSIQQRFFKLNRIWAGPVVVNPNESSEYRYFLPLNNTNLTDEYEIVMLDENFQELYTYNVLWKIASNIILENNTLHIPEIDYDWRFSRIDLDTFSYNSFQVGFAVSPTPNILSFQMADIDGDDSNDYIITASDTMLYVHNPEGNIYSYQPDYMPLNALAIPSFADLDANGYLDILIGGENSFAAFDKNGKVLSSSEELENPDTLQYAAGVIAFDIDDDGKIDVAGNMSHNRLSVWENINNNNFELKRNFPLTVGERSRTYPIIAEYSSESLAAYLSCDNGVISRVDLPTDVIPFNDNTLYEYCNLQRTAYWNGEAAQPPYWGDKMFVKNETYFYPNPLSTTFSKGIDFGKEIPDKTIILRILTTKNAEVDIKIFDIAANLIYENTSYCEVGFVEKINIEASKMASGVYFAILSAEGKVLKLKFAIEK
ncbi:MAG: hypothetical protein HOD64_08445, partial [Candidatus Cloacimonetes bacterium]|nr:hypothetical protein [Candidatus Cloacimonadota bacterium]